ncbi:MAG: 2-amino-4-hydroxy-6-hydroxymethyldihydropteridine diphosphokinase [Holophagaceae bacterium]|nr:2-amino-4-hydroxy-6-hydroxymethyldihydropteridine diphosphokinase [Holophagaceae bacterium]
MPAFIALGSNLGNRSENICRGKAELGKLGLIIPSPLIIETDDESGVGPPYLNTVVKLETTIVNPCLLLEECLRIELTCGRDRSLPPNSPRTLDLDLILVEGMRGKWEWNSPSDLLQIGQILSLILPHPRAFYRDFVVRPLEALEGGRSLDLAD